MLKTLHKIFQVTAYVLALLFINSCENNLSPYKSNRLYPGEYISFIPGSDSVKTSFVFSVPPNYNPENSYPLVVALHGYGSSDYSFHDVWKPATDSLNLILLTPRGENNTKERVGYSWGANSDIIVMSSINIIMEKLNIDKSKIFLTGFSQGGSYTYIISDRHKMAFKGIAPLNASFEENWLDEIPVMRENTKAYISFGELEQEISEEAQNASEKLNAKGYRTKLSIYEGIGHQLPQPVKNELLKVLNFLME